MADPTEDEKKSAPTSPAPNSPESTPSKEPKQPTPVTPEPLTFTTPAPSKESELKVEIKPEVKKDDPALSSETVKEKKVEIKKPEPEKPTPTSTLDIPKLKPKSEEEQKLEQQKKLEEEKKKQKEKKTFSIKIALPAKKFDCDEGNKKINRKLSLNYPKNEDIKKMGKTLQNKLGDKVRIELKQEGSKYSIHCTNKTSGQKGSLTYDKGTGKLHIDGEDLIAAGAALKESWNLMTKSQFEDSTQSLKEVSAIVTPGNLAEADIVKELGLRSVIQEEKPKGSLEVTKELTAESESKLNVTPSMSPSPGR